MSSSRAPAPGTTSGRSDEGFSLVEVVVAIALISMVMGSLSLAFIRSMKAVDLNQDRQAAVIVANQQMEFVRSLPSKTTILDGRTATEAAALDAEPKSFALSATGSTSDLTNSDTVAPAPVTGPADDLVPLSKTVPTGGTAFLVRTFIRSCWRTDSDGTCTVKSASEQLNNLLLYRVYVAVSWVPTGREACSGWTDSAGVRHCEYLVSALLEPAVNGDPLYR